MQIYRADVPMGYYMIERQRTDFDVTKPWEGWRMHYHFTAYYNVFEFKIGSLLEGKRRAEADWIERILPALTPLKEGSE